MSFFNKLKDKYMQNNLSLALLAVIIAVCLWLFISLNQYPSVQKTITIPVSTDISGISSNPNGLKIISCDVEYVTVELLGSRTQVGNLTGDNLEAYIDAENISTAGTKNLSIKIRSDSGINYEIKSITPSTASVEFDKIETRDFDVTPKTPNVYVVDGKEINSDEYVCEPSVVRITGPTAQLDKISKCYAVSNKEMSLDSSYSLTNDDVQLYTEDNVLIDPSPFKFGDQNFTITIPVRTQKTVGLSVSIVNAPDNFDKSIIKFKLSADTVTLACNNSQTEIPDILEIGKVALNEIKPDFTATFSISNALETSEFVNVSNLETVTVTLDSSELKQSDMTLDKSRITISNMPDKNYDYTVLTQQMFITVIGSEKSISEITSEDIIADVNLLNANNTSDQFTWNVSFSCPKYDDVWIIPATKVFVQRTKINPAVSTAPLH